MTDFRELYQEQTYVLIDYSIIILSAKSRETCKDIKRGRDQKNLESPALDCKNGKFLLNAIS